MKSIRRSVQASDRLESRVLFAGTPTLALHPPALRTVRAGIEVEFALGKLSATKAAGPFAVDVNWGDGSADTTFSQAKPGQLPPQGHLFSTAGLQNVDVQITSTAGLTADETLHIRVLPNTGSITGAVFDNTTSKPGQHGPPVAGATVFLDLNHDGQDDAGDPVAITNAQGVYLFSAVPPGSYILEQSLSAGTDVSTPTAGYGRVTVAFLTVHARPFGDLTTQNAAVILIPPPRQQLIPGVNQLVQLGGLVSFNPSTTAYDVDIDWGDGSTYLSQSEVYTVSTGAIPAQSHVFLHAPGVDVVTLTIGTFNPTAGTETILRQLSFAVDLESSQATSHAALLSTGIKLTTVASFGGKGNTNLSAVMSMQVDAKGNIIADAPGGEKLEKSGTNFLYGPGENSTVFRIPAGASNLGPRSGFSWRYYDPYDEPGPLVIDQTTQSTCSLPQRLAMFLVNPARRQ